MEITDSQKKLIISTQKVINLQGFINKQTSNNFYKQLFSIAKLTGPFVVIINSPGGFVPGGVEIINLIESFKYDSTFICVVQERASSMAFNILSHCNHRYATLSSRMLVHKIEALLDSRTLGFRSTATNLRKIAQDLDKDDEPFRQLNSKLMNLTPTEYDDYADKETIWTSQELLNRQYLESLVKIDGKE